MSNPPTSFGQLALDALRNVDLNHNGVPDWEDPTAWLFVAHLVALGIIHFSPAHETLAKELAERFEKGRAP